MRLLFLGLFDRGAERVTADSTLGAPLRIQRPAPDATVVHRSRERAGYERAQQENSSQHRDGEENVGEFLHRGIIISAESRTRCTRSVRAGGDSTRAPNETATTTRERRWVDDVAIICGAALI